MSRPPGLLRSISQVDLASTARCRSAIRDYHSTKVPPGGTNLFQIAPSYTLKLPPLDSYYLGFKDFVFNQIVDKETQRQFEGEKCLNWCSSAAKLVPLYTKDDPNSLFHAASLGMWGFHDRDQFLQKAVSHALTNSSAYGNSFSKRWDYIREQEALSHIPFASLSPQRFDTMSWKELVAHASEEAPSTSLLDPFFVFVLANVLRRPIVVYSVSRVWEPKSLSGIYLPLLWDPSSSSSWKSPLPLAFTGSRFVALMVASGPLVKGKQLYTLSLMDYYGQKFPVKYLLPQEQDRAVLSDYLELVHVRDDFSPYTIEGHVLCAQLTIHELPPYLDQLIASFIDSCLDTFAAQSPQQPMSPAYDSTSRRKLQTAPLSLPTPPAVAPVRATSEAVVCRTPGCEFFGTHEQQYFCSKCYQNQRGRVPPSAGRLVPPRSPISSMSPVSLPPDTQPLHGLLEHPVPPTHTNTQFQPVPKKRSFSPERSASPKPQSSPKIERTTSQPVMPQSVEHQVHRKTHKSLPPGAFSRTLQHARHTRSSFHSVESEEVPSPFNLHDEELEIASETADEARRLAEQALSRIENLAQEFRGQIQAAKERADFAEERAQEAERVAQEGVRRTEEAKAIAQAAIKEAQKANERAGRAERKVEDALRREQEVEQRLAQEFERVAGLEETLRREQEVVQESRRVCEEAVGSIQETEMRSQEVLQETMSRVEALERHAASLNANHHTLQQRMEELELTLQPFWVLSHREIQLTEEEIGRGGWGAVKVAIFRGQRVAAKTLHEQILSEHNLRLFRREMNMAARVRHPNLVLFIGATTEQQPIILTELMHTSLRRVLATAPLLYAQVISISLDIARGLNYLHEMQPRPIIHRDVSSGNVLLEPSPITVWKAKLSDFGSANFASRSVTTGPGTALYAAPEAFNPYQQQSPKMDVFSYGVLLIEMCTQVLPEVEEREQYIEQIQWVIVIALIRNCLCEDPDSRPSMATILDNHLALPS